VSERTPRSPSDAELREIAALADGSLPPERRAAVEALAESSPQLSAILAEQRRAVAAVRAANASVEAPVGLRAGIERERRGLGSTRSRRRFMLASGVATAVAAAAIIAFLVIPAGTPGAPSVVEAAALTDEPAEGPAPGPKPGAPALLDASIQGLPYPNWDANFQWAATGERSDKLGARDATTVFYEREGERLGYTIVSGDALPAPRNSKRTVYDGVEFHEFRQNGRLVVTWLRNGRTCVMSADDRVKREVLLNLAAWKGKGKVPF
jgi:hypothetical protein